MSVSYAVGGVIALVSVLGRRSVVGVASVLFDLENSRAVAASAVLEELLRTRRLS